MWLWIYVVSDRWLAGLRLASYRELNCKLRNLGMLICIGNRTLGCRVCPRQDG